MSRMLAALMLAVTIGGCGADPAPVDRLTIAAGTADSVYHKLGEALAAVATQRWSIPAQVLPSAESAQNLSLVAEGSADLGFATIDVCALALQGDPPFRNAMPIAALAGVYEDYLHVVVRADSDIGGVRELVGRKVSTGPAGSSTDVVAIRVIRAAGLSPVSFKQERLPDAEAAQALRVGAIDAFFVVGGLPTPAVSTLAEQVPIRILSVADEVAALRSTHPDLYLSRSIPANVYGLDAEAATVGIANVLVVSAEMDETTAFELTRLLFEAKPRLVDAHPEALRLDQRSAIATFSIPLHRGAQRYYRQSKPMI